MRHFLILGLFAALLACTASAAFTHSSTHTFNTSADLDRKMVLTVDFGATAHSETFSLTCQYTTTAGAAWWIMDIDRMSSATTPAEWNAGHVGWQFTTPSASGGTSTQTYITPSYSGVHHFVVYFYPSATSGLFPTTITVTVNNASQAATATNANSQIDNYLTLGIGQSGNSAGFVEHYHGAARIEALLAANTDELMYNFNVNFGATAVPLNVRIWGLNLPNASAGTTGSGPMVAEFHVMSVGGGSTPQGTCTVNDAAAPNNQGLSAAYTTPALSGNQQFRVVVKGGTGFTANKVGLFFISWQTPGTIPQTAQSPDTAAPPVTITPGG
ncbi:MAG: hypothetical protein KJ044_13615, partial [Planctomycetes bacterium]|nr:hypothetical protein [Planctomycetota bacterium]